MEQLGTEDRKRVVAAALGREGKLTPAEQRVLLLIASGARHAEIAAETRTSARTVKNHVSAILGKLALVTGAQSIRELENWIIDQALYESVAAE